MNEPLVRTIPAISVFKIWLVTLCWWRYFWTSCWFKPLPKLKLIRMWRMEMWRSGESGVSSRTRQGKKGDGFVHFQSFHQTIHWFNRFTKEIPFHKMWELRCFDSKSNPYLEGQDWRWKCSLSIPPSNTSLIQLICSGHYLSKC